MLVSRLMIRASQRAESSSGNASPHGHDQSTGCGIGPFVRAKVVKRIVRCAATNVDPETGIRDLEIPKTLMKTFGHQDLGVYLDVVTPGLIATGNTIEAAH